MAIVSAQEMAAKASQSNNKYYEHGIYVKKVTITKVTDLSNNPAKPRKEGQFTFPSGFAPEQCLQIDYKYEKEGEVKESKMYLMASYYYKDSKNKLGFAGWRFRNNPIYSFLSITLGNFGIDDVTFEIPRDIERLKDVEVYMLSYCTGEGTGDFAGKAQFNNWNKFSLAYPGNDDKLVEEFREQAEYLIKNNKYNPDFYKAYKDSKQDDNYDNLPPASKISNNDLPF